MDPLSDEPVGECDEGQDEQEESAGLVVKEPADEHQIDVAQMEPAVG